MPRADLRWVPSPLHSAEPIREDLGLSPELLASWALRRAYRGGVAKSGDQYFDYGRLALSYLTRTPDELTEAGLLALAEEDPWGLRRVSLPETGHTHYAQLTATPRRVTLSVPEPQFPRKTPAGRRSSCPDPLVLLAASRTQATPWSPIPTKRTDPDPREGVPEIAGWPPGGASDPPTLRSPGPAGHHHANSGPPVRGTTPAPPPRPTSHRGVTSRAPPFLMLCQVEQIAVRQQHGAMSSRLHQHGQVIGRDTNWLHVRFDKDHRLIILRAHLVRVLDQAPDGD